MDDFLLNIAAGLVVSIIWAFIQMIWRKLR